MTATRVRTKSAVKLEKVEKRNGIEVSFDLEKVKNAIRKALEQSGEGTEKDAEVVAHRVLIQLQKAARLANGHGFIPHVESVQDLVEDELYVSGYKKTAKSYILYREERAKRRKLEGDIPEHVRKLTQDSKQYMPSAAAEFTYYRSYSRWIEEEGRRETWIETVGRYMRYMKKKLKDKLTVEEYAEIEEYILKMMTMPSMRLMWSAGDACDATNATAYNCSYVAPTNFQDVGEILYLLCCGCGVGFSVESQNVQQFPVVEIQRGNKPKNYVIEDSKEGWADALVHGLKTWFSGHDVTFDYSKIRPAGARLKTMGGRSSGPEPLRRLLAFTRNIVVSNQGSRLAPIDWHDIMTMIGEIVVAGGVRRSAEISLSDLNDRQLRKAKEGHFYVTHPHRRMANNSAVYRSKPSNEELLSEWISLIRSGSGERGIFNRGGLTKQVPERRLKDWEKRGFVVNGVVVFLIGTNPCGEINLLSKGFCNLTEIIARAGDTLQSLLKKVRIATILGTFQSTLTDFKYLSPEWKENAERERLLGVSITGQWDSVGVRDASVLAALKEEAIKVNKEYAKRFGVSPSLAITCVKPSGTVSLLVDSSSGMHPRFAKYYIRRIRISVTEPLYHMLKDQGIPADPEVGQTADTATTFVFAFPVKAPDNCTIFQKDVSALEQLEYWKTVKYNYTEHNPSVSVYVGKDEWISVINWVQENWDLIGGLSFFPKEDTVYQLAPHEEIDKKRYEEMLEKFKHIDYAKIMTYEKEDQTQGSRELACAGGFCELP